MYTLGCSDLLISANHKPLIGILNDRDLHTIKNPRIQAKDTDGNILGIHWKKEEDATGFPLVEFYMGGPGGPPFGPPFTGFQAPPSWGGLHNSVGGPGGPHVENQFLKKKKGRQNSKLAFSTSKKFTFGKK